MTGSFLITHILLCELGIFRTEFRLFIGISQCMFCTRLFLSRNILIFKNITSFKNNSYSYGLQFSCILQTTAHIRTAAVL
jgi:hypothetical protein